MSCEALLRVDDPPVFLIARAKGASAFLLTCDHAGREIPHKLASLSLSERELSTHVAWDLVWPSWDSGSPPASTRS